MIIYPAIDILNGKGVRLKMGNFNEVTEYGEPKLLMKNFEERGAKYIHIVDLNGSKSDEDQLNLILDLLKDSTMKVQVAGGIRSIRKAEKLIKAGADQIVLGTSVIKDFKMFETLVNKYPNQVSVAVDVTKGRVAIEGWLVDGGSIKALISKLSKTKLKRLIYTDISRDGMMMGPNFSAYEKLLKETKFQVIASGGVTSLGDIQKLKSLGVSGVIIGKSIYENKLLLEEVLNVG